METMDMIYKIKTDFPLARELLNIHVQVTDTLCSKGMAIELILSGWKCMPSFAKSALIFEGFTIEIEDTEGDDDMDIYDILWDEELYKELIEFFPYDFLDDVRNMSEDEFKELFA